MGLDDNKHLSSLVLLYSILLLYMYISVSYTFIQYCITCHMRSHLCMDINCYLCGQLMYTALGRMVCKGQTASLIKLFVEFQRTCGICSTYIQLPVHSG